MKRARRLAGPAIAAALAQMLLCQAHGKHIAFMLDGAQEGR